MSSSGGVSVPPILRESFVLSNAMPKHSDKPAEFYVGLHEMHAAVIEQENCLGSLEALDISPQKYQTKLDKCQ